MGGVEYLYCALRIYLSKGSAGMIERKKRYIEVDMDRRWGVLRLVGGVLDAESGRFEDSREERVEVEVEEEARVIDTATSISTTPVTRRQPGLRWIITLERFPGISIPWEIRYFLSSPLPPSPPPIPHISN